MRGSIHGERVFDRRAINDGGYTLSSFVFTSARKAGIMDIMDFLSSWTFMAIMAVLLVVLIGVLLFLRSKRPEE